MPPQLRDSWPGPAAHPDSEQQRPIQGTVCLQDESELRKQAQCDSGALARRLQAGGNPKALRSKFDIWPPGLCSGIRNSCLQGEFYFPTSDLTSSDSLLQTAGSDTPSPHTQGRPGLISLKLCSSLGHLTSTTAIQAQPQKGPSA